MSLSIELQQTTSEEISAAFRAAKLRYLRPGYSLITALTTPCVERALRLQAVARKRAQAKQTEEVPA